MFLMGQTWQNILGKNFFKGIEVVISQEQKVVESSNIVKLVFISVKII